MRQPGTYASQLSCIERPIKAKRSGLPPSYYTHCLHWSWKSLGKICCWCNRFATEIEVTFDREYQTNQHHGVWKP